MSFTAASELPEPKTLTVAVLTYRRLADITALLPELGAQIGEQPLEADILVVDNDPGASAQAAVAGLDIAGVRYVHEPEPGIAAARNRALDEAAERDLLVFIDDDERPVEGWLSALLATRREAQSEGVVGPVASRFTGEPDPWIVDGGYFTRRRLPSGTPVTVAATNNLLLDLRAVRARGLRFDRRLGLIGGEDTLFTRALTNSGGRIIWCAEAMVHDIVPTERMTRSWVVKRAFRMGGSASRVEIVTCPNRLRRSVIRVRQIGLGGTRLGAGLARLLLGAVTFSSAKRAAGVRNLARGAGLITGALGYEYREYGRS